MKELVTEKNDLINKLSKLEKKSEDIGNINDEDERIKRFRRTAQQIDRHYICPNEQCQKSYGSEGSLNQHIKLKHPELMSKLQISDTICSYTISEDLESSQQRKQEFLTN